MRYCPDCDAYLTRAAVLAMQLRRVMVHVHTGAGHAGQRIDDCSLEPCKTAAQVLNANLTYD